MRQGKRATQANWLSVSSPEQPMWAGPAPFLPFRQLAPALSSLEEEGVGDLAKGCSDIPWTFMKQSEQFANSHLVLFFLACLGESGTGRRAWQPLLVCHA